MPLNPSQMTAQQRRNKRSNTRRNRRKALNNPTTFNRSEWDFVLDNNSNPLATLQSANQSPTLQPASQASTSQATTENSTVRDSCAGSVILEGSVNGIYQSDSPSFPKYRGPFHNGEYEVENMSVCTGDHGKFRTHWKGYNTFTLEPRCHLRNSPSYVNKAIDKYNENRPKGHADRYKRRRAVEHDIPKLLKEKVLQCKHCGQRASTEQKMLTHSKYCINRPI